MASIDIIPEQSFPDCTIPIVLFMDNNTLCEKKRKEGDNLTDCSGGFSQEEEHYNKMDPD